MKIKSKILAFRELLALKSKHSKLQKLTYIELRMQNYLKSECISSERARAIFKSRTRMTRYWENFKGTVGLQKCKLCNEPGTIDSQGHSFECKVVKENIEIKVKFTDIFGTTVDSKLAETIEKIEKFRKEQLFE